MPYAAQSKSSWVAPDLQHSSFSKSYDDRTVISYGHWLGSLTNAELINKRRRKLELFRASPNLYLEKWPVHVASQRIQRNICFDFSVNSTIAWEQSNNANRRACACTPQIVDDLQDDVQASIALRLMPVAPRSFLRRGGIVNRSQSCKPLQERVSQELGFKLLLESLPLQRHRSPTRFLATATHLTLLAQPGQLPWASLEPTRILWRNNSRSLRTQVGFPKAWIQMHVQRALLMKL